MPVSSVSLAKIGVKNMEMEISALLTLASLGNIRAGAVCAVYAQRNHDKFINPKQKDDAELRCIRAGLAAFDKLADMDQWKKKNRKKFWTP